MLTLQMICCIINKKGELFMSRERNHETRCEECHTPCQGFVAPNGKVLCADCLWKIWGIKPHEADKY